MKEVKVFILGEWLLSASRLASLRKELKKRKIKIVNPRRSDVFIYIIGSDPDESQRQQLLRQNRRMIVMRAEHDEPALLCALIGEAVEPEQAAQWAWSVINEPERWTTMGGKNGEKL